MGLALQERMLTLDTVGLNEALWTIGVHTWIFKSRWKILRLASPLGSDRLFPLSHSEDRQDREKEVARE